LIRSIRCRRSTLAARGCRKSSPHSAITGSNYWCRRLRLLGGSVGRSDLCLRLQRESMSNRKCLVGWLLLRFRLGDSPQTRSRQTSTKTPWWPQRTRWPLGRASVRTDSGLTPAFRDASGAPQLSLGDCAGASLGRPRTPCFSHDHVFASSFGRFSPEHPEETDATKTCRVKSPETSLCRSLVQIGGPQPLAGEQVAGLLLRDPDLNPCFSHDHVLT
jgi:hypothetical protein